MSKQKSKVQEERERMRMPGTTFLKPSLTPVLLQIITIIMGILMLKYLKRSFVSFARRLWKNMAIVFSIWMVLAITNEEQKLFRLAIRENKP
jgi:hypothetical protein